MVIYRRFVALCTGLSLLHLTTVGNDLACVSHGSERASQPSDLHASMAMPHTADAANADHTAQHHAPLDAPARTNCCQGMTSCSTTVLVATVEAMADLAVLHEPVVSKFSAAPASLIVAPEPPPPKS